MLQFIRIIAISVLFGAVIGVLAMDQPPQGWTTTGVVTNVVDGDTVDIEVRRVIRVRLIDCWAPEKKIDGRLPEERQAAEKQAGLASKANLKELALGKQVVFHVPTDGSGEVSKVWTMGRVLGTVWIEGSEKSLNEIQVEGGFATKAKREELKL